MGVNAEVLIKYMVENLGIEAGKNHTTSPATMMFSVLSLAISEYEHLSQVSYRDPNLKQSEFDE